MSSYISLSSWDNAKTEPKLDCNTFPVEPSVSKDLNWKVY